MGVKGERVCRVFDDICRLWRLTHTVNIILATPIVVTRLDKRTLMRKNPAVYMLASGRNGTLYVGVTSNLAERVWKHRSGSTPGFTGRFRVDNLVWYEFHETMEQAIGREKALKKWRRGWKIRVIELSNPGWDDLFPDVC